MPGKKFSLMVCDQQRRRRKRITTNLGMAVNRHLRGATAQKYLGNLGGGTRKGRESRGKEVCGDWHRKERKAELLGRVSQDLLPRGLGGPSQGGLKSGLTATRKEG